MGIILDAAVIIAGEKGAFDLQAWISSRPNDNFELGAISIAELWHGVERAEEPKKTARIKYLSFFTQRLPIIPYAEQSAYEHARILAFLSKAGTPIGAHDAILSAIALNRGSAVATFNVSEFQRVPGLTVIRPA